MKKEIFLKSLAEHGYNVMFGAKKHFATHDIVEKVPSGIALITLLIGIWQLYAPSFDYSKEVSLVIILVSVVALQINLYNSNKEDYMKAGIKLTEIHNELKDMYYQTKSSTESEVTNAEQEKLQKLLNDYYAISITKQITFSDWYAHYKFFYQAQHEWIDEQKSFTWKDRFPMSLRMWIVIIIITILSFVIKFCIEN
ncbi:SLATT domain-containing protein [Kurthia sp. YJT4]|uniref:SLATT domain-containing protein n=1 Tax=Kurthia sp. YJT4 TaxID=3049086 RepID=UPI00254C31BA|nr:SLATT domain-containing protein [Kurthia sp. YJT4]WIL38502.1 SLATT domain-containing protein [Kurthia sp. YJT4]